MTTIREEIRRLAEKCHQDLVLTSTGWQERIESAILAGVKQVLELIADQAENWEHDDYMTQKLLKELTEEDRNAETKRSTA